MLRRGPRCAGCTRWSSRRVSRPAVQLSTGCWVDIAHVRPGYPPPMCKLTRSGSWPQPISSVWTSQQGSSIDAVGIGDPTVLLLSSVPEQCVILVSLAANGEPRPQAAVSNLVWGSSGRGTGSSGFLEASKYSPID